MNEMMDNFAQILRRLPTCDRSSSSDHETPFKVQLNFDIPLFEGLIYEDVVDKWLNILKGYFLVHNFFDMEKIIFSLLKVIPHVKDGWNIDHRPPFSPRASRSPSLPGPGPMGIITSSPPGGRGPGPIYIITML
jgi:hypothetical protein